MSSKPIRVWRAPIVLGASSALGLVAALLSDGAGDVIGWLALGTPVAVIVWCVLPATQRSLRESSS